MNWVNCLRCGTVQPDSEEYCVRCGISLVTHDLPQNNYARRLLVEERNEERRPMLSPEARYQRDPMFRTIVDSLELMLADAIMTGTEIREAAILAAIHYEMRRLDKVNRIFVGEDEQ